MRQVYRDNPLRHDDWAGLPFRFGRLLVAMATLWLAAPAPAQQRIYPVKDGTILDEGADGVPDEIDPSFNGSTPGYEGAITLLRGANAREIRVFWEFNLAAVSAEPPLSARLTFTLRGATVSSLPTAVVAVLAYPADLLESLSDFSAGPISVAGAVAVAPLQPATTYTINVSGVVSEALANGLDRAGFRFQIAPLAVDASYQAFMDALDTDQTTKPFITIGETGVWRPHDYDVDDDVDLQDFSKFVGCVSGNNYQVGPGCKIFIWDADGDVDLLDFGDFQRHFDP